MGRPRSAAKLISAQGLFSTDAASQEENKFLSIDLGKLAALLDKSRQQIAKADGR